MSIAAADMTRSDWRGLIRGFLKFMAEEAREPEHAEDDLVTSPSSAVPAAAGVLYASPTRVLFTRRSSRVDNPGSWCFPGGGMEPGETPAECAAREAKEEVGRDCAIDELLPLDRRSVNGVDFETFLCRVPEEFEPELSDESTAHVWVPWGEWPEPLHPGVAATLEDRPEGVRDLWDGTEVAKDITMKRNPDGSLQPTASYGKSFLPVTTRRLKEEGTPRVHARPGPHRTGEEAADAEMAMDPLTDKGRKILASMKKEYGEERGERVFYASKNKGTISGIDAEASDCGYRSPRFAQDRDFPIQITLELSDDYDNLSGLLAFLRYVRSASLAGHGFTLEADRENGAIPEFMKKFGLTGEYPTAYIDGDGADKVGRILLNGDDVSASGPGMAADRALQFMRRGPYEMALDRSSARAYDADGRLHVDVANISKACVNPYFGREIPDYEALGLEPDRKYLLLRDPEELEKAATSFNNLPILSRHVPVTAESPESHHPELVVGSTGTDARFEAPYLRNSLVLWAKPAIDAVEANDQRQLSCAYRYRADMASGIYDGRRYDGVMRDLVGNHVALVREGRAGADVIIGDEKPKPTWHDIRWTAVPDKVNWKDRRFA